MLRMEIALILVLIFIAFIYFDASKKNTPLHRTFSVLLVASPLMHNYPDCEADELMSAMMNFGSLFNMIMTSKSAMQRVCNG